MLCTDAATADRPQQRPCSAQSLLKITGGIDASVPDGSAYDGFSCALKACAVPMCYHVIHSRKYPSAARVAEVIMSIGTVRMMAC